MNEVQLSIILEFKGPTAFFFCQLKSTCFAFVPQAWTTEKSWSKSSVVTGCPAPRTVPAPYTSSCSNAGRGTPRSGPPLSIYKPSWRITSLPLNHNTNPGTTSKHGAPAEYATTNCPSKDWSKERLMRKASKFCAISTQYLTQFIFHWKKDMLSHYICQ